LSYVPVLLGGPSRRGTSWSEPQSGGGEPPGRVSRGMPGHPRRLTRPAVGR